MNNQEFFNQWADAAYTSAGFFWMALWAFVLGYAVSSLIQVFVSQDKMQKAMGKANTGSVALASFFGLVSSSCSFSALATTKSLFQKGASFVAALAFLLGSTNLVIELGIVISIFLGWQFVVGEYAGGILLILISWLMIRIIKPGKLIDQARQRLGKADMDMHDHRSFRDKVRSIESWSRVGMQYGMEWQMVWKDVTVGFTIAGIVSAFVPNVFFQTLFIHSGGAQDSYDFWTLMEHVLVGPVAAFLTFIGSMGNIPIATLLFNKGVSFAGVMAFIFSDLVVFPVLRINARYYGWKMAFFILFLLFVSLFVTSLLLHYGLLALDLLPSGKGMSMANQKLFEWNYTTFLNIAFVILSGILIYLGFFRKAKEKPAMHEEHAHTDHHGHHHAMAPKSAVLEITLKYLAFACYAWLTGGLIVYLIIH